MLHDLLKDATEHLESMCNQITYAFRIVKAHQKTKWYSLEELLTRSNLTITQVKKKDTAFQTRPSFSFFFLSAGVPLLICTSQLIQMMVYMFYPMRMLSARM